MSKEKKDNDDYLISDSEEEENDNENEIKEK